MRKNHFCLYLTDHRNGWAGYLAHIQELVGNLFDNQARQLLYRQHLGWGGEGDGENGFSWKKDDFTCLDIEGFWLLYNSTMIFLLAFCNYLKTFGI